MVVSSFSLEVAKWPAELATPANAGDDTLVPPTIHQPLAPQQAAVAPGPCVGSNRQQGVEGAARAREEGEACRDSEWMLYVDVDVAVGTRSVRTYVEVL